MISPKKVPKCAAGWLWLSHLLQQLHSFLTFFDRWDTQLKIKMGPFDWAQQMLLVYWVEVDTVCSATRVIKSRATMLIRVPLSLCLPSFEYQLKYQSENLHVHQNQSRRGRGENRWSSVWNLTVAVWVISTGTWMGGPQPMLSRLAW